MGAGGFRGGDSPSQCVLDPRVGPWGLFWATPTPRRPLCRCQRPRPLLLPGFAGWHRFPPGLGCEQVTGIQCVQYLLIAQKLQEAVFGGLGTLSSAWRQHPSQCALQVLEQIPSAWGVDGGWDQHPIPVLQVSILPTKHCPCLSFQIGGRDGPTRPVTLQSQTVATFAPWASPAASRLQTSG